MPGLIQTATDLSAAIVEYLGRDTDTTLIARVPWFIQAFEAKMNRDLFVRQMELRVTALTDPTQAEPEYIAVPADFQSMRRIRLTDVRGKPQLEYKSNAQLDEFRTMDADVPGRPRYFTIFGSEIELAPTPAQVHTLEMVYRQNVPPLSGNATNWLLTLAPDLYLYGSLLETAPYIKEDARLTTWGTLYAAALSDLNELGQMSTYNAGPLTVRPSGRNTW